MPVCFFLIQKVLVTFFQATIDIRELYACL
jgi:hypothetical protein